MTDDPRSPEGLALVKLAKALIAARKEWDSLSVAADEKRVYGAYCEAETAFHARLGRTATNTLARFLVATEDRIDATTRHCMDLNVEKQKRIDDLTAEVQELEQVVDRQSVDHLRDVELRGDQQRRIDALEAELTEAKETVLRAFVKGAAWWEFQKEGATMWQSDQHRAYEVAKDRAARNPDFMSPVDRIFRDEDKAARLAESRQNPPNEP